MTRLGLSIHVHGQRIVAVICYNGQQSRSVVRTDQNIYCHSTLSLALHCSHSFARENKQTSLDHDYWHGLTAVWHAVISAFLSRFRVRSYTYIARYSFCQSVCLTSKRPWNSFTSWLSNYSGLLKLLTLRADCATRGHEYKLFVNNSRLNIRKHFFTERVVSVWNNLENGVIKFSSLTCFKNSLLLCDLSKYVNF